MHRLEMHLMFCYNEFWIYLHIFSHLKSILLCKIMFTATPIQFIYIVPPLHFSKFRGWPLNRDRTVLNTILLLDIYYHSNDIPVKVLKVQ